MIEGYTEIVGEEAYNEMANRKADNSRGNESPFKEGEQFVLFESESEAKPHFFEKPKPNGGKSVAIIILLKNVVTGAKCEFWASSLNKRGVENQHYVENMTDLAVKVRELYAKEKTNKEIGEYIIDFFKAGKGICSVKPWTERVVYSNGNSQNKLRHLIGFIHENTPQPNTAQNNG